MDKHHQKWLGCYGSLKVRRIASVIQVVGWAAILHADAQIPNFMPSGRPMPFPRFLCTLRMSTALRLVRQGRWHCHSHLTVLLYGSFQGLKCRISVP